MMLGWETVVIRLVLAFALGGLVGIERERADKPAGLRTHMVVSLASALVMLLSIHVSTLEPGTVFDPGRIAAGVVTGIGFLGAGTIIRQGSIVRGLTTAASLWFVAGLGLAIGAGFIWPSAVAVVLVLLLFFANVDNLVHPAGHRAWEITYRGGSEAGARILRILLDAGLSMNYLTRERTFEGVNTLRVSFHERPDRHTQESLVERLHAMSAVQSVSFKR